MTKAEKKAKMAEAVCALKEKYPDAECSLDYGKDYELLMVPGAAHSLRREPAFARKALQFLADSLL